LRAPRRPRPVRTHQPEPPEGLPDRPAPPVVLPVDVHPERAAEGDRHGPRHDRWPPAVPDHVLPELPDRDPRLGADAATGGIPVVDAGEPRAVEDHLLGVARRVPVALPSPTEAHRAPLRTRRREHGAQPVDGARPVDEGEPAGGPTPAHHPFDPITGGDERAAHMSRRWKMTEGMWRRTNMIA